MMLPVIADNQVTALHYLFLFHTQNGLVEMLKAIYGRPRGTIICKESVAIKCDCDYAMPSHHAGFACMEYLILLDFIDRTVLKTNLLAEQTKKTIKVVLSILSTLIVALVSVGRVYQSVHLYSQIISSLLITLSIYLFLNRRVFEGWLGKVSSSKLLAVGLGSLFLAPVVVYVMNQLMTSRTQPETWRYWNKCSKCQGSFVPRQTFRLARLFAIPGLLIGTSLSLKLKRETLITYQYQARSLSNDVLRLIVVLAIMLPIKNLSVLGVYLISKTQSTPNLATSHYAAETIAAFLPAILANLFLTNLIYRIFQELGISYFEDFVLNCIQKPGENVVVDSKREDSVIVNPNLSPPQQETELQKTLKVGIRNRSGIEEGDYSHSQSNTYH